MSYRIHRDRWWVLSPRELQVLQRQLAGKPPKTIALSLGIRVGTVRVYQSHTRNKLRRWASVVRGATS